MFFFASRSLGLCLACTISCLPILSHAQNREVLAEYKIGIIGRDMADPTYQAAHAGAKDAALELSQRYSIDIELLILTPEKAAGDNQSIAMARLLVEDADGLIISPEEDADVVESIEFAAANNQSVVLIDTPTRMESTLASIIPNEFEAGRTAGKAILEQLPTRGRVAILMSDRPSEAERACLSGVRSAIGYKRIETIVRAPDNYVGANAAVRTAEEADRNHFIKGWVFLNDAPLRGAPALPWKPGKLPCVAVQSSPTALLYLDQGYLSAFVTHPYYDWGRTALEIMIRNLHKEQLPEPEQLKSSITLIDRNNSEAYRSQWQQWLR